MKCFKNKVYPSENITTINFKNVGLKAFDLILFKSVDGAGKLITSLEKAKFGESGGLFSHTGIIITTEVYSDKNMKDGELYIFESTASGRLGGNIYDINSNWFIGCQIRNFHDVLKSYTSTPGNRVAFRKVLSNPLETWDIHKLRERFAFIIGKYNGKPYVVNIMELFSALFPSLRIFRNKWETKNFIFCSELVAIVYKEFNIIKDTCNPANVVPSDFIIKDEDGDIDLNKFGDIIYLNAN